MSPTSAGTSGGSAAGCGAVGRAAVCCGAVCGAACRCARLLLVHAELPQRQLIELAARRDRPGELELGERGLCLGAEVAVDRTGIETERTELVLHLAD